MPRHVFTEHDASRFIPLIRSLPPAYQNVLTGARLIKDPGVQPQPTVDVGPLPAPIQTKATPDGIPLHALLGMVQAKVGVVHGMVVRDGRVNVLASRAPTAAELQTVRSVISDKQAVAALQARPALIPDDQLHQILQDPNTKNDLWMQAFRQYATTKLIAQPDPKAVAPVAVDPKAVAPVAVDPKAVAPVAVDPKAVAPVAVDPKAVAPIAVDPKAVAPVVVDPKLAPPGNKG